MKNPTTLSNKTSNAWSCAEDHILENKNLRNMILNIFHCTTWKLGFLNISEYLATYGIQMDPSVTKRRWKSGKKPVLCMLGLLSTIIRGMERADQESVRHGKIALAHEHNSTLITSTSAREVARTSAKRLGHPAGAGFFFSFLASLPPLDWLQLPQVSSMKSTTKLSWFSLTIDDRP